MSPRGAIYLLIYVAVVLGIAWAIDYAATRAGAPQPLRIIIWVIAALILLLLLLQQLGGVLP